MESALYPFIESAIDSSSTVQMESVLYSTLVVYIQSYASDCSVQYIQYTPLGS
jgi:hypothetical protein